MPAKMNSTYQWQMYI